MGFNDRANRTEEFFKNYKNQQSTMNKTSITHSTFPNDATRVEQPKLINPSKYPRGGGGTWKYGGRLLPKNKQGGQIMKLIPRNKRGGRLLPIKIK